MVDDTINRTVQVFGAIYVRTDGESVVMAQMLQRPSDSKQWFVSELHPDATGRLTFQSAHEDEPEEDT